MLAGQRRTAKRARENLREQRWDTVKRCETIVLYEGRGRITQGPCHHKGGKAAVPKQGYRSYRDIWRRTLKDRRTPMWHRLSLYRSCWVSWEGEHLSVRALTGIVVSVERIFQGGTDEKIRIRKRSIGMQFQSLDRCDYDSSRRSRMLSPLPRSYFKQMRYFSGNLVGRINTTFWERQPGKSHRGGRLNRVATWTGIGSGRMDVRCGGSRQWRHDDK